MTAAPELDGAIRRFVAGAKLQHIGTFLADHEMEVRGLWLIQQATGVIDRASPNGREILIPLLGDSSVGVQVTAAGGLWAARPDLVIPLLRRVECETGSEVGDTAMWLLFSHGEINACPPDPRFPDVSPSRSWGGEIENPSS